MKKINLAGLLLSLAMLGACAKAPAAESSETAAAVTSEETVAETTAKTTMEQVTETAEETIAEIAEEYVNVSPDNEFIDYEFIADYQGTTDIGELADKAVEYLKNTDFYARSLENIALFTEEEFAPYIKDGVIVPKFNIAYPNDYDGDGETETFIEVDMPYGNWLCRFYIFADGGGNMSFIRLSPVWLLNGVKLLDYGRVKHIVLGGDGTAGAESDSDIYCVENGGFVSLYGGRHNYRKNNCFLYTTGWQGSGDFMYFDINEGKYFKLYGEKISVETIKEMDKDNTLSEFYEWADGNNFLLIELIGKKYYVFSEGSLGMEHGGEVYVYENGKFIQDESCQYVRRSDTFFIESRIVDIEQAIANMKPVQN